MELSYILEKKLFRVYRAIQKQPNNLINNKYFTNTRNSFIPIKILISIQVAKPVQKTVNNKNSKYQTSNKFWKRKNVAKNRDSLRN